MEHDYHNRHRRRLLKAVAGLGGAVALGKTLPERWTRPVVEAVLLPAHAATSFHGTGTYSNTRSVVMRDDHWFDLLVPRAYANSVTVTDFTICMDVTDQTATVSVYYKFGSSGCALYAGTITDVSSFTDVGLTYVSGSGDYINDNRVSGTAGGSTIAGTLYNDHTGTRNYAAALGICSPVCSTNP